MTTTADPQRTDGGWRPFLRRGLVTQVLCVPLAAVFWLAFGSTGGYPIVWLYSGLIGACCWLAIDGAGQLLERRWPVLAGWGSPRGWRLAWQVLRIVAGTCLGYIVGHTIADLLMGRELQAFSADQSSFALSFLAAAGASYYFISTQRLREERLAAEQARRLATEARLKLLESQLEPHMLFNTLANLRALIGIDPARAQEMLDRLNAFLRATLGASRTPLHPLAAEFERVADYLELMAIRMGPRLAVALELPADLRAVPVPPLILQPLVENAIQHGLEPHVRGGRIMLRAVREGAALVLVVHDTGVGLGAGVSRGGAGFGTAQVRERLAAVYGPAASLRLAAAEPPAEGTIATLRLPLAPA